ncbi:MAG: FHA domain-containing protein [Methylobacterium frigidaeris]
MTPTLRLTVTEPGDVPAGDRVRTVTGAALRIGREDDNDWVLTDPARRMSRHHCTVDFQGGVYIVIDTSANGVFHNSAPRPIGRGNSRILSDGDVLRFPGVTLAVALIEDRDARDAFRAVLPPRRDGAPLAAGATPPDPLDDLLARPGAQWGADPLDDTALPEAPDAGLPFGGRAVLVAVAGDLRHRRQRPLLDPAGPPHPGAGGGGTRVVVEARPRRPERARAPGLSLRTSGSDRDPRGLGPRRAAAGRGGRRGAAAGGAGAPPR